MQPAVLRAAGDPLVGVRVLGGALALSVALLAGAGSAEPTSPAPPKAEWGYALANELMSPWCPGFALPDCSSGYASELRHWILEQERLGRTEEDVKAEILARYGEKMLQAPKAEGRGVLAYAIPAAIILGGFGVLVAFLRKQGGGPSGVENPGPNAPAIAVTPDTATLARVDAELAHFERAND